MSSPARRRELAALRAEEERKRYAEQQRKSGLTMRERIEELDADRDLKEILHTLAQALGLEQ